MILAWLCRFNIIYQILFLSAAVRHPTIHELTETAADPDVGGGGGTWSSFSKTIMPKHQSKLLKNRYLTLEIP